MTNNVNISRETVAFGRTATVHRCDHGCGETLNELSVAGSMGSLIAAEIARCDRVVIGMRGVKTISPLCADTLIFAVADTMRKRAPGSVTVNFQNAKDEVWDELLRARERYFALNESRDAPPVSSVTEFYRPITVYVSHEWADVVNSPSAAEDLAKTVIYEIGLGQEMVAVNMGGIKRIIPSCADVLVFLIREAMNTAIVPARLVFVETNDSVWYSIVESCKRYDRGNRLSTQRKPPMVKSIWPQVATIKCEGGKVQTTFDRKVSDAPPVSSARSVAEFETERMTDDERWAAEWWSKHGDRWKSGANHWCVKGSNPMSVSLRNGDEDASFTCTAGQFLALMRFIDRLGK